MPVQATESVKNLGFATAALGRSWVDLPAKSGDVQAIPQAKRVPSAEDVFAGIDVIGKIDKALGNSAPRVAIFSTARMRDTIDYRFIHDIAYALVDIFQFKVGSGGGPAGMAYSNEGAARAQLDRLMSWAIAILLKHEKPHTFAHEILSALMESFLPRKMGLIHLSDMVIAVPGGYGTLEEIFEVLGLMMRGEKPWGPIILLEAGASDGKGGFVAGSFFEPLKEMLSDLKARGALDLETLNNLQKNLHFVDAPDPEDRMEDFLQLVESLEPELLAQRKKAEHITHPQRHGEYKEAVEQDLHAIHGLLEHLDSSTTISVIGASHMLDRETARDVGRIVKKMMLFGANVLYSGESETNKRAVIEAKRVERRFADQKPGSDRIPGRFLQIRGTERSEKDAPDADFTNSRFMGRIDFASNPMRKAALTNYSNVYFLALGVVDTFDLLFEIMTLIQTQKIKKAPIILFDPNGEWEEFVNVCKRTNAYKTINPEDLDLFKRVQTVKEAEELLKEVIRSGTPQPAPFTPKPSRFDADLFESLLQEMGMGSERAKTVAAELVDQNIYSHEVMAGAKSGLKWSDPQEQRVIHQLNDLESTDGPYGHHLIKAGLYAKLTQYRNEFSTPLPNAPEIPRLMGRFYTHRQDQPAAVINAGRLSYHRVIKPSFTRPVRRGCVL